MKLKRLKIIICIFKGHKFRAQLGRMYINCQRCGADVFKEAFERLNGRGTL